MRVKMRFLLTEQQTQHVGIHPGVSISPHQIQGQLVKSKLGRNLKTVDLLISDF